MTSKELFNSIVKNNPTLDFTYTSFLKAKPKDQLRVCTAYPELRSVITYYNLENLWNHTTQRL